MLFKNARWRKFVVPLLLVMGINFSYVPVTQAGDCSWKDVFTLGISCVYKMARNGLIRSYKREYDKMVDEYAIKIANHINNSVNWNKIGKELGQGASDVVLKALQSINWEEYGQKIGAGLRKEFEATMDKLFAEKIRPLLREIDMVLANRLEQADKIAENRLKQLDGIIEARLKQVDALIQSTFDQFRVTVDYTITKVRTDLIDYTFSKASEWRDETIAKIRKDLLDHSFAELEKLRQAFRNDVEHVFDRTEYLVKLVDCTEEKVRIDMENTKKIADELLKKCPPLICGESKTSAKESTPEICYEELNLKKPPQSWEYSTLYDLNKCDALRSLTPQSPVRRILNVYLDLQAFAARMACIQRGAPQAKQHYMQDLEEFGKQYDFWYSYQ